MVKKIMQAFNFFITHPALAKATKALRRSEKSAAVRRRNFLLLIKRNISVTRSSDTRFYLASEIRSCNSDDQATLHSVHCAFPVSQSGTNKNSHHNKSKSSRFSIAGDERALCFHFLRLFVDMFVCMQDRYVSTTSTYRHGGERRQERTMRMLLPIVIFNFGIVMSFLLPSLFIHLILP